MHNAGLRRYLRAGTYFDVIFYTDLPCQNHKITKVATAGNSDLRNDYARFADSVVVPYLDKIVYDSAVTDNRVNHSASVNTSVSTYFNKVADNNTANLRNL